jgi:general secretion pathway protein K
MSAANHRLLPAVPRGRGGFALVSVLWVLVGVSALALAANLAAREAVASARNRADLAAAGWGAEGCLERARAAVGEALAGPGAAEDGGAWGRIDRAVAESPLLAGSGCAVELRAAGAALDANAADAETLRRLFHALGRGAAHADSLADALLDWRDADDAVRPFGAEAAWYRDRRLHPPRNGPFADAREIVLVRAFGALPGIDTLLSAEPGRVPLTHAPPAVLASLPGFGAEAAARVAEMRMRGGRVADLAALGATLSPGARDELLRRFHDLAGRVAMEPDAWIVRARGAAGSPPAVAVVEARLVRAGERAAVVRRRTWAE